MVQQAPALPGAQPISPGDRIYTADQTSNTVSVIDPYTNEVLGTIPLGKPRLDGALDPMDRDQVDVHGLGFSRDGHLLDVISVASGGAQVIDTATNAVLETTSTVGRAPHEGFISPDGSELWVAVRGDDDVAIINISTGQVTDRVQTLAGPSKVVFSPDGTLAYVNHLFANDFDVIDVATHKIVASLPIPAEAAGSSDEAVTPDGKEVWLGHPLTGKTTVVDTASLTIKAILDTGPRNNHPNFITRDGIDYAYVTVGGLNEIKVYQRPEDGSVPDLVDTIQSSGAQPHGIWPSPDGSRIYVALQNSDAVDVIDTATNQIITTLHIGQDPQALVYVAGAVPDGQTGTENLSDQGLNERVENIAIQVRDIGGSVTAQANVRDVGTLDQIGIAARGLTPNQTFTVYASNDLEATPLLDVTSNGTGTVEGALAFTRFFDNYDALILQPKGDPSSGPALHTETSRSQAVGEPTPAYVGPVSSLQSQLIWSGSDSVTYVSAAPDVFLHGGSGDDALQASAGSNVLDGGSGSNLLIGSNGLDGGTDTFFVDGRSPSETWDTLVNFHLGDAATLWGFEEGTSTYTWSENEGTDGFKGATLHAETHGAGTDVNASLTFAGMSVADAQSKLGMSTGTVGGTAYPYLQNHG